MWFLFYNLFKRMNGVIDDFIKGSNILSCPNSTGYETFFVFQFCLEVQTKLKSQLSCTDWIHSYWTNVLYAGTTSEHVRCQVETNAMFYTTWLKLGMWNQPGL